MSGMEKGDRRLRVACRHVANRAKSRHSSLSEWLSIGFLVELTRKSYETICHGCPTPKKTANTWR
jgi:hypothetical protein